MDADGTYLRRRKGKKWICVNLGIAFFRNGMGRWVKNMPICVFFLAKTPENPKGEKRGDSDVNLPM